jgi:hypothetical protein
MVLLSEIMTLLFPLCGSFFAIYQVIKRELIYFNGENSPYVGGGMIAASLLPFIGMKSIRTSLPPVLMLCALDFYHDHSEAVFGVVKDKKDA